MRHFLIAAAAALFAAPALATPVTIDFNGRASGTTWSHASNRTFQEDGFQYAITGGAYFGDEENSSFAAFDDDVLFLFSSNSALTITAISGATFDLFSFAYGSQSGTSAFSVTGYTVGGGTVTGSASASAGGAQTFTASGFTGLTSLVLDSTSRRPIFDDIVVEEGAPVPTSPVPTSPVPLPAAAPLLLAALGVTGLIARRRKG